MAQALAENGAKRVYILGRRKQVLDDAVGKIVSATCLLQAPHQCVFSFSVSNRIRAWTVSFRWNVM